MIRMAFFERANKSEFRFLPLYSDSTTFPEYIVSPGQVGVDSLARGLDFSLPPAPEDGRPQRGGHPAFLSGPSFVEVSLWRLGGLIRGLLPFRGKFVRLAPIWGWKRLPGPFPGMVPGRGLSPQRPGSSGWPCLLRIISRGRGSVYWQSGQAVQPRKSFFVFWFVLTVRGWLHCGQFLAEVLGCIGCIFSSFRSGFSPARSWDLRLPGLGLAVLASHAGAALLGRIAFRAFACVGKCLGEAG